MTDEPKPRKVQIDMDGLMQAFEDHDYDNTFYLDLESGEVLAVRESDFQEDVLPPVAAEVESHPQRYFAIPPLDPDDILEDMAAYIGEEGGEDMLERFDRAVDEGLAGNTVEEFLAENPEIREGWPSFHRERLEARIREWLLSRGVEAVDEDEAGSSG